MQTLCYVLAAPVLLDRGDKLVMTVAHTIDGPRE